MHRLFQDEDKETGNSALIQVEEPGGDKGKRETL